MRERRGWRARLVGWLAQVLAVPVGRDGDGVTQALTGAPAGSQDKTWPELAMEFSDALEAWRRNPLARRIISLITAYVVGDGIRLASDYGPLGRWLTQFMEHAENHIDLREADWCDELARSGELFIVLHTNPVDGMSYVRTLPAVTIDQVHWRAGDYEAETEYHELVGLDDPDYQNGGRWWSSPLGDDAHKPLEIAEDGTARRLRPWVLHFAVNRPVGCVRGESDLAPILVWLRRYSKWLEDRVRLNAAVRAFLWVVRVPANLVSAKREQYRVPPEGGSVIIADRDAEEWQAVAPTLNARDAQADGRQLRYMIAAGGPGLGLSDLGEAETSNLATARAMGELRWRMMTKRQHYFSHALAMVAITAYNRAVALGKVRGKPATVSMIHIVAPDISAEDNAGLASAAASIAQALGMVAKLPAGNRSLRRLVLRLVLKFAGESLGDVEMDQVLDGESEGLEREGAK